jgi:hypothetical protein
VSDCSGFVLTGFIIVYLLTLVPGHLPILSGHQIKRVSVD